VREVDTVARFGGDEFVVLIDELDGDSPVPSAHAIVVAEKIRHALSQPYCLAIPSEGSSSATVDHDSTTSIGITLLDGQIANADEAIRRADSAMYQAKREGPNAIRELDRRANPGEGLTDSMFG
jgi:diguanylate cyclase (GGDEF)-like protein